MNNKAQTTTIYGMMLGITIIILALALAPAVGSFTNGAMNATWSENHTYEDSNGNIAYGDITHNGLDCNNESISNFDKATCVATDMSMFYFLGVIIFIGGAFFTIKLIFDN